MGPVASPCQGPDEMGRRRALGWGPAPARRAAPLEPLSGVTPPVRIGGVARAVAVLIGLVGVGHVGAAVRPVSDPIEVGVRALRGVVGEGLEPWDQLIQGGVGSPFSRRNAGFHSLL